MSELVWIHRFNSNELGLRGAGRFCLVPVDARIIFFPEIDFDVDPDISEKIQLKLFDSEEKVELTYGKPPSKSEHRLSLTGDVLDKYIGDEVSDAAIKPGNVGCFFRKENEIYLTIAEPESAYGRLLDMFPSRGKSNNLVTQTIVDEEKLPSDTNTQAILSKPFLLLAGISGTGKTRFIRKQAEKTGSIECTYCLTSVRPDWLEPSDLLGYTSRLSGNAEYIVTDVLKFIVKAWIAIKEAGIILQGKEAFGEKDQQQQVKPYWLCLDEMNLAPVEQYFADYLSVLETREWAWQGNDFTYQCDPLLKATVFETVDKDKLKGELGLLEHDELWDHFVVNGISIPFNLIVAGTVNMDETTHGFSRKVIDRALTFDFGEFFPNNFDAFFDATSEPKALSYPVLTDGRNKTELSRTFDKDGTSSVAFLKQVNDILENTPFKLAYRALNELLLAVITQNPNNEIELQSVWDDFLMCKVLPRIEGDIDKLSKGDSDNSILDQLSALLSEQLDEIWATKSRQDLFRQSLEDDSLITIECRSKVKLGWMSDQLKNGFTSFWP